jgi:hypothetical protein
MTIQRCAQLALEVQDACNLSGVANSLTRDIIPTLWDMARAANGGTPHVNQSPIVTLFLLKLGELNGACSTLEPTYEPAEKMVQRIAAGEDYWEVVGKVA